MALEQVNDFRAEAQELDAFLAGLDDADWQRETAFKGWTINDVIQHLHYGDILGHKSATDVESYAELRDDLRDARAGGKSIQAFTREKLGHLVGADLLATWRQGYGELCDALAAMEPGARLKWSGPDMGVRMFATARQMEIWAHGQEIYDIMGQDRAHHDRIKNIAVIGVKTYSWTFANRGLEPPGEPPHVRLTAPSGEVWDWNEPSDTDIVEGDGGRVLPSRHAGAQHRRHAAHHERRCGSTLDGNRAVLCRSAGNTTGTRNACQGCCGLELIWVKARGVVVCKFWQWRTKRV